MILTPQLDTREADWNKAAMQYEREFAEALQFMWGKGFLSPGGP
jgi:hypothetical protein